MANPSCVSVTALITAQPCFTGSTLTPLQRKSLLIWFRAKELAAIGGTNYTAVLASTLLTDSNSFVGKASFNIDHEYGLSEFETAQLVIEKNNAVAAGASISSDINALMISIAPLSGANQRQLDAMLLFLLCRLGVHKAYTQ